MSISLTARYVFPADAPPVANGVVVINDDKIASVEPPGTRTTDLDLGNAAIIPGLVNAHTHLDLTGARGLCPPTEDFTQWLRSVIKYRRDRTPEQTQQDIKAGITECMATGTTLVGDIAAGGASWEALNSTSIRAVVFYEIIGNLWERVPAVAAEFLRWLEARLEAAFCRPALSPHAPYSVHQTLIHAAAKETHTRKIMLAIHLAETQDEIEFLKTRGGRFAELLKELDAWNPKAWSLRPSQYVKNIRRITRQFILVHCNYLTPRILIPPHASIVYCPRTHAAFNHSPHPFREFLKRGVRVALGTDSLASNPDLDLLSEMRFIHERYPDFPGDALLRMGTLSGAEALGWEDETGSLTPGKSADLAVVPLNDEEGDPHHLLFSSPHRVSRTLFRGQWR